MSVGAGLLRVIDLGSFSDPAHRSADGSQDVLSWDPSARFGSPSATGRGRGGHPRSPHSAAGDPDRGGVSHGDREIAVCDPTP